MRSYLSGFPVIVTVAFALFAIAGDSIAQTPRQREAPSGQREPRRARACPETPSALASRNVSAAVVRRNTALR
jgi:hypothetical protein